MLQYNTTCPRCQRLERARRKGPLADAGDIENLPPHDKSCTFPYQFPFQQRRFVTSKETCG